MRAFSEEEAAALAGEGAALADQGPEALVRWAAGRFPGRAFLSCSFGVGGIALAHVVSRVCPQLPVVFIDTGFHFPATLALRDQVAARLGLRVLTYRADLSVAEQARRYGPALYRRDADRCCALRKVEPMRKALRDFDAWLSALRRDQGGMRAGLRAVELHEVEPGRYVVKVHPLAGWDRRRVWDYLRREGLPYHPLLDEGYTSIGCWPCTARPRPGAPERSGRWAGTGKTECGLHTFSRRREPETYPP